MLDAVQRDQTLPYKRSRGFKSCRAAINTRRIPVRAYSHRPTAETENSRRFHHNHVDRSHDNVFDFRQKVQAGFQRKFRRVHESRG